MRRFVSLACCSLVVAMALASGCSQEEGDPCQEQDDCASGLSCCPIIRSAVERGTCNATCSAVVRDAGPGTDAGPRDAGAPLDAAADAAADADAGLDAAAPDDAGTLVDAGTDAGTPVDAGTDAGVAPVDAGTDAGTDAG